MRNRASSIDHRKAQERGGALYHRPPARLSPIPDSHSSVTIPQTSSPAQGTTEVQIKLFGIPIKYVVLVTLAAQNAALSIFMHYSRIVTSPGQAYSAGTAVLMNELLKGVISYIIALSRTEDPILGKLSRGDDHTRMHSTSILSPQSFIRRFHLVWREVFSTDCWKLSIPAILYVIQNNLQFVAAANLDVVVFQVSYQMKILTTAACSVIMLGRRLSPGKWLSLFLLALGVAIVQLQISNPQRSNSSKQGSESGGHMHTMHHVTGISAVIMACFTSGLAGVYFEMVLKRSTADLWVRNVQLSLFSLLPALSPILFGSLPVRNIFDGFGFWAWLTVITQVVGGLITALVIKFSDNIIKGFATSISILLSFLASVVLFNFRLTPSFVIGASIVMGATWMYNQPQKSLDSDIYSRGRKGPFPRSPSFPSSPILGQFPEKRRPSLADLSPRAVAAALGLSPSSEDLTSNKSGIPANDLYGGGALAAHRIHSNVSSRAPSPPLSPSSQENQQ